MTQHSQCPSIAEFCYQLIADYGITNTYQHLYIRTFAVALIGK